MGCRFWSEFQNADILPDSIFLVRDQDYLLLKTLSYFEFEKKKLKEKEATSCRPSAFWAVECTRGTSLTRVLGSIRTRTGAYWTCLVVFLVVVNKELVRERASAYLVTPFDTSLCFQTAQSVPCFLCTPTLTFLAFWFAKKNFSQMERENSILGKI